MKFLLQNLDTGRKSGFPKAKVSTLELAKESATTAAKTAFSSAVEHGNRERAESCCCIQNCCSCCCLVARRTSSCLCPRKRLLCAFPEIHSSTPGDAFQALPVTRSRGVWVGVSKAAVDDDSGSGGVNIWRRRQRKEAAVVARSS